MSNAPAIPTLNTVFERSSSYRVDEWPAFFESYNLVKKIGRGAFATVWRANCPSRGNECCAIKILDLEQIDSNLTDLRLEVQTMRLSSHPNVLTCYTSFVKDAELWLVTQLMSKGSSLHCVQSYKQRLGCDDYSGCEVIQDVAALENHITFILHQTIEGLKYIHENGQIHRDIKAGNILLDGDGNVRIADFGVSGWLENAGSRRDNTKTFVGTPCWMAPEVMEQVHGYDYKADIWSLGITALELAKGYAPYAKYQPMKVLLMTIQEPPPSFETYDNEDNVNKWSRTFRDMIKLCLVKDPKKRPNCEELLSHKHFKNFADENFFAMRQAATKAELCDPIDDVGIEGAMSGAGGDQSQFPGMTPLYLLSNNKPSRPAGTSWVFSDGSQVLSSSGIGGSADDDDTDDFFDEFEKATGGEHFSSIASAKAEAERRRLAERRAEEERLRELEKQEMDDFFDEFEKSTGGENFRKPRS